MYRADSIRSSFTICHLLSGHPSKVVERKEQDRRKRKRKRKSEVEGKAAGTENIGAYRRPAPKVDVKRVQDKKLKSGLKRQASRANQAAFEAARAEILLPEEQGFLEAEGLEKSYHFKQEDIVQAVDVASSRKVFDLTFEQFGPYAMRYTQNGRHLLLGGAKGHVASFDWKSGKLGRPLKSDMLSTYPKSRQLVTISG